METLQPLRVHYQISLAEYVEMARLRHRSSLRWIVGLGIGFLGVAAGILYYFAVDHGSGIFMVATSSFFLALLLLIPTLVFRKEYRNNPKLFGLRTVVIGERGIVSDSPLGHIEATWDNFEKLRETENLFVLYQSRDVIGILPKRVFASQNELDRCRTLLAAKIPTPRGR